MITRHGLSALSALMLLVSACGGSLAATYTGSLEYTQPPPADSSDSIQVGPQGGDWENRHVTLSWTVTNDDPPDANYPWNYTYTFSVDGTDAGIDRLVIEAPSGMTANDISGLTGASLASLGLEVAGAANPGMPEDMIGLRFAPPTTGPSSLTLSFWCTRAPVWGDFYAAGIAATSGAGLAYNHNLSGGRETGFLDPDGVDSTKDDPDPPDGPDNGSIGGHILRPCAAPPVIFLTQLDYFRLGHNLFYEGWSWDLGEWTKETSDRNARMVASGSFGPASAEFDYDLFVWPTTEVLGVNGTITCLVYTLWPTGTSAEYSSSWDGNLSVGAGCHVYVSDYWPAMPAIVDDIAPEGGEARNFTSHHVTTVTPDPYSITCHYGCTYRCIANHIVRGALTGPGGHIGGTWCVRVKRLGGGVPIARIRGPVGPVLAGGAAHLNGTASTDAPDDEGGESIVRHEWTFEKPGGGTESVVGSDVYYTWSAPGTYTVTLTVTDNEGWTASASVPVVVVPVYGTSIRSLGHSAALLSKLHQGFRIWGRVSVVNANRFMLDDGSGTSARIDLAGHGLQTGDFVSADVQLDSVEGATALVASQTVRKWN